MAQADSVVILYSQCRKNALKHHVLPIQEQRKVMPVSEKTTKTAPEPPPAGKRNRGRPPKGEDRIPRVLSFFERVASIDPKDWGTRAWIKIYRVEPSIDRLRLNEPKHIAKYSEPIDEDRIKQDHGSGRYRLYLNFKSPDDKIDKELDTIDIDILDMHFPPKLAKGEWLDIPANQKWEWCRNLLPKNAEAPIEQRASAMGELAETLEVLDGITSRAAERAAPQSNGKNETLEVLKALKELNPPPPPSTENALLNTVVDLMKTQIAAAAQDNRELRKEIADMRNKPETKGGVLGNLTGIVGEFKSILPDLKEMFPGLAEKAGTVTRAARSSMTGDQEFWQPIVSRILEAVSPAVPFFVSKLMTPATNGQQPPAATLLQPTAPGAAAPTPGAPGAPAPAEPQPFNPAQAFEFLKQHAKPFLDWFKDGMPGGDFAESIFNLYGADWQGLPWLHAKATFGADNILALFKRSPMWPEIASMETKFAQFVADFVAWQPGEAPADGEVIETTAEAN
jgi:hypothetical protein